MPQDLTIIPSEAGEPANIEQNIVAINAPLGGYLQHVGLPTENILSPVEERRRVIQSLESVLEILPIAERHRATYISKFAICVTVGLFDGALSFLWDETVKALRQKVIEFDLEYFYSIAQILSSRYRGLRDSEDISAVSEHDLLEICRRIGLIDDVNHRRLEHVNYFRNHASAAHPNDNPISGIELLGFLEHCLRYAICAPVQHSVIQVKRLLDNIRQHTIDQADYRAITDEVSNLPRHRIDDILLTVFGMYCDPNIGQNTLNNVRGIGPSIWNLVSEDVRLRIGSRFGYYRANGDVPRKDRTQEFLDSVGGNQYKDEDSLGAELIEKLQHLRAAHYGMNNFYNEFPHAQSISQSLPRSGIPRSAIHAFVKTIATCFIGNGHGYREGVDENALPFYEDFISRFGDNEIIVFAALFQDHEFTGDMHRPKAHQRAIQLCNDLHTRTSDVRIQNVLSIIANCPNLQQVRLVSDYRRFISDFA